MGPGGAFSSDNQGMKSLKVLKLSHNKLQKIPQQVGALTKLKELGIDGNGLGEDLELKKLADDNSTCAVIIEHLKQLLPVASENQKESEKTFDVEPNKDWSQETKEQEEEEEEVQEAKQDEEVQAVVEKQDVEVQANQDEEAKDNSEDASKEEAGKPEEAADVVVSSTSAVATAEAISPDVQAEYETQTDSAPIVTPRWLKAELEKRSTVASPVAAVPQVEAESKVDDEIKDSRGGTVGANDANELPAAASHGEEQKRKENTEPKKKKKKDPSKKKKKKSPESEGSESLKPLGPLGPLKPLGPLSLKSNLGGGLAPLTPLGALGDKKTAL